MLFNGKEKTMSTDVSSGLWYLIAMSYQKKQVPLNLWDAINVEKWMSGLSHF